MKRDKHKSEAAEGIAVRFGEDVLKAMRWQCSDKVQFAVDSASNTAAFRRVQKDGYTLSRNGGRNKNGTKSGSAAARIRSHSLAKRIPRNAMTASGLLKAICYW